jgi:hypothetical protein
MMKGARRKRKVVDVAESDSANAEEGELQVQTKPAASKKRNNVGRIGTYFPPRTTPGAQPTLKSVIQSK